MIIHFENLYFNKVISHLSHAEAKAQIPPLPKFLNSNVN